jgi:hypothetical protein
VLTLCLDCYGGANVFLLGELQDTNRCIVLVEFLVYAYQGLDAGRGLRMKFKLLPARRL